MNILLWILQIITALIYGDRMFSINSNKALMILAIFISTLSAAAERQNMENWGETNQGLKCRLRSAQTAFGKSEKIELTLEIKTVTLEGQLPVHILLPKKVDRNHFISLSVQDASGKSVKYIGPKPPSGMGDIDDLPLKQGEIIKKQIDMTGMFDLQHAESPFKIRATVETWSYETHFPRYWTGKLESNELALTNGEAPTKVRQGLHEE